MTDNEIGFIIALLLFVVGLNVIGFIGCWLQRKYRIFDKAAIAMDLLASLEYTGKKDG